MAPTPASGLGGLGLVEVAHALVRLIDQLVGRPGVVVGVFVETGSYQIIAVLRAAENVHIALVALIDPL